MEIQRLQSILPKNRVRTTLIDRIAFSTDASFYQLIPKAIVHPTTLEEIRELFAWSKQNKIPLTFRAAGSSLSGQAVTDGVLVEITRGFNSVHVLNNGARVRVGTAVRGGYVNTILKKYNAKIGPDPASINTCMIGGIVANNASGMCCGTMQNSYHTLHSMTFMLTNGVVIDTSESNADARLQELAPEIAEGLLSIQKEIRDNPRLVERIRSKYSIKNTMGYSLNAFLDFDSPVDILQHLLVGSEGTLAFIADVVFTTVPALPLAYTGLLTFNSIEAACKAISPLRDSNAAAVELMDRHALRSVEHFSDTPEFIATLHDESCILLTEYQFSDVDEMSNVLVRTNAAIQRCDVQRVPFFTRDANEQALFWKIRKGMMPTIGGMRPTGTSLVNEDVAFKPNDVALGVRDLRTLMIHHGYPNGIIFGHAKDGNMHFILPKKIQTESDIIHYEQFMDELADLIVGKYDGSLKAEHSTGRNMAPYLEREWGSEAYAIMKKIKRLLDPENILNPDVILSDDKKIHTKNIKSLPTIDKEIDRCIECGFCESHCPSRTLTLTPRQRIGIQREIERRKESNDTKAVAILEQEFQYNGVETCAVDGLCGSACPVHINTGEYIKSLRGQQHSNTQNTMATWVANNFRTVQHAVTIGNATVRAAASVLGSGVAEQLTNVAHTVVASPRWNRHLGSAATVKERFTTTDDVVYFPTCTTRTIGAKNGESVADVFLRLCSKAGISVRIPNNVQSVCCGNVFQSKGYNDAHQQSVTAFATMLYEVSDNGKLPIVIDSSSCTYSVLQSQLNNNNPAFNTLRALTIIDITNYTQQTILPKVTITQKVPTVVLHPVCANTKLGNTNVLHQLASACANNVIIPHTAGCCGFAGDRGLLYPELTTAATQAEAQEVQQYNADGYYSTNTTCEIAMTQATGKDYRNILYLLDNVI